MRDGTMGRQERKRPLICGICGGRLKETRLTHEERRGAHLHLIRDVPAQVCLACGEKWISEDTLRQIDLVIRKGKPAAMMETPVYSLRPARLR